MMKYLAIFFGISLAFTLKAFAFTPSNTHNNKKIFDAVVNTNTLHHKSFSLNIAADNDSRLKEGPKQCPTHLFSSRVRESYPQRFLELYNGEGNRSRYQYPARAYNSYSRYYSGYDRYPRRYYNNYNYGSGGYDYPRRVVGSWNNPRMDARRSLYFDDRYDRDIYRYYNYDDYYLQSPGYYNNGYYGNGGYGRYGRRNGYYGGYGSYYGGYGGYGRYGGYGGYRARNPYYSLPYY